MATDDRTEKDRGTGGVPGPWPKDDTGTIGNTDEASSENRRDGIRKDRERADDPEDIDRDVERD